MQQNRACEKSGQTAKVEGKKVKNKRRYESYWLLSRETRDNQSPHQPTHGLWI